MPPPLSGFLMKIDCVVNGSCGLVAGTRRLQQSYLHISGTTIGNFSSRLERKIVPQLGLILQTKIFDFIEHHPIADRVWTRNYKLNWTSCPKCHDHRRWRSVGPTVKEEVWC